jgi:hypothetical protein
MTKRLDLDLVTKWRHLDLMVKGADLDPVTQWLDLKLVSQGTDLELAPRIIEVMGDPNGKRRLLVSCQHHLTRQINVARLFRLPAHHVDQGLCRHCAMRNVPFDLMGQRRFILIAGEGYRGMIVYQPFVRLFSGVGCFLFVIHDRHSSQILSAQTIDIHHEF